jgi:hypothetical protein
MMKQPSNKEFDCIAMKREAQSRIYEETKDMTHEQQIEYFRLGVHEGSFRDWWEHAGSMTASQGIRAS